jgi:mRNA interferase MazF
LKRGDIWTVSGAPGYGGKPRPVVIVQGIGLAETQSVTVCGFTTDPRLAPTFRFPVSPTPSNGLRIPCQLMIDKIITVPKSRLGTQVGRLDDHVLKWFDRAIVVYLGIAGSND